MQSHEIVNRLSLLYGKEFPMVTRLERAVNSADISSIFTLSQFLLGQPHIKSVRALMNLVYQRRPDNNVYELFKVLHKIYSNSDAMDALRNVMDIDDYDRKKLYLVYRVLHGLYPNDGDFIDNLKNITCGDGEFPRERIYLLFNVVERALGSSAELSVLKNVCANKRFVNLETELLFRVISGFAEPSSVLLDSLKNIVSSGADPDLYLMLKLISAFDPECGSIKLLKSNVLNKTKLTDTVDVLTDSKFVIPRNMQKMINRFASTPLTDAFSSGQLRSKLWLVDTVNNLDIDLGNSIYVCAGWYGVLSALMFERLHNVGNIYSFDIDPSTDNPADTLNKEYILNGSRFKSFVADVRELQYIPQSIKTNHYKYTSSVDFERSSTLYNVDAPTCVINTSCEHIEDFDQWFANIPSGTLVVLQNNNFIEHEDDTVVNTVNSEDEWSNRLQLTDEIFKGTLNLDLYDRYMVIGFK